MRHKYAAQGRAAGLWMALRRFTAGFATGSRKQRQL
jgi:hypothetical protein